MLIEGAILPAILKDSLGLPRFTIHLLQSVKVPEGTVCAIFNAFPLVRRLSLYHLALSDVILAQKLFGATVRNLFTV